MYLLWDPKFTDLWNKAHSVKERFESDDKNCQVPWSILAMEFNDYDQNNYNNITVAYGGGLKENVAAPGHITAFESCKYIDPTSL